MGSSPFPKRNYPGKIINYRGGRTRANDGTASCPQYDQTAQYLSHHAELSRNSPPPDFTNRVPIGLPLVMA